MLALAIAPALAVAAPADGATVTLGLSGWRVQSSALDSSSGEQISTPGFDATRWLSVRPDDAGAPGTELTALLQNGECPDVFFGEHLRECFGYMSRIGPVTVARFAVPWWWRTDFDVGARAPAHASLIVSGVVGAAGLWLNGHRLASTGSIQGAYARYVFALGGLLRAGTNSLAVEVAPNDPLRMLTLDDVDWNEIPPDNNTGIQFPIQLHSSGTVSLSGLHVLQSDSPTLSTAALTLRGEVANETDTPLDATVAAVLRPPAGAGEPVAVQQLVQLAPRERRTVSFEPSAYPALELAHPAVWWPYGMGSQPLYGVRMTASSTDGIPDSEAQMLGIRTISTELVGRSKLAPQGVRVFLVNGRPIVIRGGGWAEDLFLRYSEADTAAQAALIHNLGLNTIRTEGKEMPQDFYEQMDRAGILIDAGYQCCDAWQPEGTSVPKHELNVMELSSRTIGEALRDHPSVLAFGWSDNPPTPAQERVSLKGFAEADFPDPLISSAEYRSSRVLGPSGEKEGPYDWVPPAYWYDRGHYLPSDPTRTDAGGAWGFDSEASAGDTVPTLDSIGRFMSSGEQEALWRQPEYHQFHANYETELPSPENGGYAFGTLYNLDRAITGRYGAPESLASYVEEAQAQNYETQRAEFEAYIDHADSTPTPSTGVIYWMLNKGMPTLLWDLYNEEYDQAGSYFGAQEANRPVHALLAYDTNTVTLDNLTGATQSGLALTARVYSLDGTVLDEQSASNVTLTPGQVLGDVIAPRLPAPTPAGAPGHTYFVQLLLARAGEVIDRNTYWLSTRPDQIDWPRTAGLTYAAMRSYADLSELRALPGVPVAVTASTHEEPGGAAGETAVTSVKIENPSGSPGPAFLVRADIRRGRDGVRSAADNEVLPVLWSQNDVTLWPGESVTLTAEYSSSSLRGQEAVVSVGGWNVPAGEVAG